MILGLDISTSITGVTLLDYNNNIILNNSIDLRKYKNFFIKSEQVAEVFKNLSQKPDKIFIEQSLQSFDRDLVLLQLFLLSLVLMVLSLGLLIKNGHSNPNILQPPQQESLPASR